jgi:hypothetical protein
MIWLTWRQFRAQAIVAAAALVAFAIVLAVTQTHMDSMYHASGLTSCHGGTCAGLATQFLQDLSSGRGVPLLPAGTNEYVILYFLSVLVILLAPAIIGTFWGAPLIARELETGTCRLAWNQSVTRNRWLAVKLSLTGVAAMVVTEAFSLVQAWWAVPIGKAVGLGGSASIFTEGWFGFFVFPTHGITPLGYAAFGFVLGVALGLLIRHLVRAMAATLVIFAVVQFVTPLWIRPNLIPPSHTTATIAAAGANADVVGRTCRRLAFSGALRCQNIMTVTAGAVPGQSDAWIISSGAVNAAGQQVSIIPAACASAIPSNQGPSGSPELNNCLASHGIGVAVSYQPASRYWPLQLAETGLYLALALALGGYCFRRLDRRRT